MNGDELSKPSTPLFNLGWSFWVLMLLIVIFTKLLGFVGGLVVAGLWSIGANRSGG